MQVGLAFSMTTEQTAPPRRTDEMPLGSGEMSLIPFPYKEIFDEQLKSFDVLIFDNFNFKPACRRGAAAYFDTSLM